MNKRNGLSAGVLRAGGVGLALLGMAASAHAQDLTIDSVRTTPLSTTEAGAGDVVITDSGAIVVETEAPAVTVNSDTDVTVEVDGQITNGAVSNATGIYYDLSSNRAADLTLLGDLSVGEPDFTAAVGTNNRGILIGMEGQTGVLTGDVNLGLQTFLVINGDDSVGIELNTEMVGNLSFDGTATFTGDGAVGLLTRDVVDGEIVFRGSFVARGTATPSVEELDKISGSAVQIGASVTGGIYLNGPIVTGETVFSAAVRSVGGATALHISPEFAGANAATITLGAYASFAEEDPIAEEGYSFINRGTIRSDGIEPGRDAEGMRIGYSEDAAATPHQVVLSGGLYNRGIIGVEATSFNGQATDQPEDIATDARALVIARGAVIAEGLVNEGSITATTTGPGGGTAIGLLIEEGAVLPSIVNTVAINGRSLSPETDITTIEGVAIRDLSGTLTSIVNRGTIEAVVTETDVGSTAIAIDNSTTAGNLVVDNVNEEDATRAAIIQGQIRFGTGTNTLNIEGRLVNEDDEITDRALVASMLSVAEGGTANVNVYDGTFQTRGSSFSNLVAGRAAGDANFDADDLGRVEFVLPVTPSPDAIISTSGTMTFYENSQIAFSSLSFLGEGGAYTLLDAEGGITFENLGETVTFDSPFLYNSTFTFSDNEKLSLVLDLKDEDELGLTGNLASIYDSIIAAALEDDEFGRGLVSITDEAGVRESLSSLVPNIGVGARALTIAVTDTITGPIGQRQRDLLTSPAQQGLRFWGQQFYEDQNAGTTNVASSYFGSGTGVAVGFDWGPNESSRYGLSYTYFAGQVTETLPRATKVNIALNLVSAYASWRANNFFIMPQANIGYASYDNRRRVVAGTVSRTAISDWSAYLASGGITTGYEMNLGAFQIIPHVSIDGLYMSESGYVERFGGDAVNLELGSRSTRSVRLFAGIAAQTEFMLQDGLMKPQVLAGWSYELLDDRHVIDASFEAIPGTDFAVVGPKSEASRLIGGAGFSYLFDNWSAAFNYDAAHNSGAFSQSASVTMTSRF